MQRPMIYLSRGVRAVTVPHDGLRKSKRRTRGSVGRNEDDASHQTMMRSALRTAAVRAMVRLGVESEGYRAGCNRRTAMEARTGIEDFPRVGFRAEQSEGSNRVPVCTATVQGGCMVLGERERGCAMWRFVGGERQVGGTASPIRAEPDGLPWQAVSRAIHRGTSRERGVRL